MDPKTDEQKIKVEISTEIPTDQPTRGVFYGANGEILGIKCGRPAEKPLSEHDAMHSIAILRGCNADWNLMSGGDDQMRKCYECGLCVYKLAEPSSTALYELAANDIRGRKPPKIFRRSDGTFILQNCYRKRATAGLNMFALIPCLIAVGGGVFSGFADAHGSAAHVAQMWVDAVSRTAWLVFWHIIGCALLSLTIRPWTRAIIVLIFNVPMLLCCLVVIGSLFFAIAHATGW